MKKVLLISAIAVVGLLAGCSGGGDPALNDKAPPPSAGATPEAGNPNKPMPQGEGPASMGDGGMAKPETKPEGA